VDGMISVIAHELTEAITDTYGAWYDANGYENGGEIDSFILISFNLHICSVNNLNTHQINAPGNSVTLTQLLMVLEQI